jgi:small subunit ribosomal protein S13
MARFAGVDIPDNKRGEIALTYIFGIGRSAAVAILTKSEIDVNKKVKDWNDEEALAIRSIITAEYKVEGVLKSEVQMDI